MLAGWILGYYVADYFLGSFPWGSIIGTMLGAGLGFFEIFRLLMRRRDDR
jgi:F0F1-type ATP synthase assembly protein I